MRRAVRDCVLGDAVIYPNIKLFHSKVRFFSSNLAARCNSPRFEAFKFHMEGERCGRPKLMSERPSGKPRGNRWQPVSTGFMIQQSIKPFRDFHRTYVLRGFALSFLEPPVLRQPNGRVKIHLLRAILQAVNLGAIWISRGLVDSGMGFFGIFCGASGAALPRAGSRREREKG